MSESIVTAIEAVQALHDQMVADLPEDPTVEDLQDQAIGAALCSVTVALLDTAGRIALALEAIAGPKGPPLGVDGIPAW